MTQQLFEQWFHIADADKDGAVGGAEAVSFFTRSGLPQTVLGQIWDLASGGGPKLNHIQFSSAMRLVALAQARGGQLPLDQARAIIAGVGPSLPLPTLQGLEPAGAPPAAPSAAPPPVAAALGPRPAVPATPQYGIPAALSPYAAQLTGGAAAAAPVYAAGGGPGVIGSAAPPPPPPGGYPPLPALELQRHQASFLQLDTDRDGFVTGAECFGFFSQSGLEKAVLRDIWSLVAGNDSRLSAPQFVAFLYLIDFAKRGLPLPKYLPPGLAGFPPLAAAPPPPAPAAAPPPAPVWSLQSQFGTSSNIKAVLAAPPVTAAAAPPPPPPAMPAKLELASGDRIAPPVSQHVSAVPAVSPALLANVSAMDRTKLQEEQQGAEAVERALVTAEERTAEARARQAALTGALQELVVFRKRTEVALLTSQDQARRLEEELEATRRKYDAGYVAAQAASEKSAALHAHILELMGQKTELEDRMRRLEGEVAAAERMSPEDVARLEGELAQLGSQCTALEAARAAKMAQADALRRQQDAARAQLADLRAAEGDAAAEVDSCRGSLEAMEAELKEARASGVAATLPALLSRAAAVYRGLYGMAHRTGTAVPFEALPASLEGLHVWADELAAGVAEWADDDVDARGYVVINALPGAGAPRPVLKAAPKAAAAAAAPAPAPAAAAASAAPKMFSTDFAAPESPNGGGVAAGFDDPPAFSDAPAFGAPPVMTGAAPAPSSAPVDFDDAPAFSAPGAVLDATASFAIEPQQEANNAFTAAASHSVGQEGDSGASGPSVGFSFGREGEHSVGTPTAAASVPSASATSDNDAFAAPQPAAAAAALAATAAGGAGRSGGGEAVAQPIPAAAAWRPAADSFALVPPSLFGDDAFGGAVSGFGGAVAAAATRRDPSAAPAAAVAPVASEITAAADGDGDDESPPGSFGGAPPGGRAPVDSGALESNPFAFGAPPAALAGFAAVSTTAVPPQPAAAAAAVSSSASAELFGDSTYCAEPSSVVTSLAAPAPPPPAAATAAAPPAANPPAQRTAGFDDSNPFGDDENPFGSPPAFR